MTTAARGPDFGVAIFWVRHSPDPANMDERRDKQRMSTNICPLRSNVRGKGKGARRTLDGLDFGKGKVGATPAIAAWYLRIDATRSRTLSSRTTIGDMAITLVFLSPLYTSTSTEHHRRIAGHQGTSHESPPQIRDTVWWGHEVA